MSNEVVLYERCTCDNGHVAELNTWVTFRSSQVKTTCKGMSIGLLLIFRCIDDLTCLYLDFALEFWSLTICRSLADRAAWKAASILPA